MQTPEEMILRYFTHPNLASMILSSGGLVNSTTQWHAFNLTSLGTEIKEHKTVFCSYPVMIEAPVYRAPGNHAAGFSRSLSYFAAWWNQNHHCQICSQRQNCYGNGLLLYASYTKHVISVLVEE